MQRLTPLDGLRGLAILWVIPHNSDTFPEAKNLFYPFALVAHSGWIGVQLFFVLSGFLITSNLLDSRGARNYYYSFYARRALRIFPLYFTALTFVLVLLPIFFTLPKAVLATYDSQIWLWLFLNNWAQAFGHVVYWFPHFWSLAIEEQFYLVWPCLIAAFDLRGLIRACVAIVIASCALRVALLAAGVGSDAIYLLTPARMDALAVGAVAALLRDRSIASHLGRPFTTSLAIGALFAGALASHLYSTQDALTITLGYTLLAVFWGILLLNIVAGLAPRWLIAPLNSSILRSVGRLSFAMYVLHIPIEHGVKNWLLIYLAGTGIFRPLLHSFIVIVLSYIAALACWHLLEKHFLKLKSRFEPIPTGASGR
jgi:peptidoglycan/LPS O-acetylase OafA/YrhL